MNFKCRGCKSYVTKKEVKICTEFMEDAGLHSTAYHMEWVKFAEGDDRPLNERAWDDFDDTPEVGRTYIMRVTKPFDEEIGNIFTTIFEPSMMAINGWSDARSPEHVYRTAAVLCRFTEVLWADEFTGFIHVEVLNVVLLADLHKVLPVTLSDTPVELFGDVEEVWTEYEDEHWLCRNWSGQGDVGEQQFLYTDENGVAHEVMTSWFDFHADTYYLSNNVSRERTGFDNGNNKRCTRFISEQQGYGIGYIDELHHNRMSFAFFRNTDGTYTSSAISCSDWFRIEKDFPVGACDSPEKAEEFRKKYISENKVITRGTNSLPRVWQKI